MGLATAALASVAFFATYTAAVTPLAVRGADFVNVKDGTRFQMLGMAYQPGGTSGYKPGTKTDPLSSADLCTRDAALMQSLGLNTVRIYNLDPAIDHSACASIFNAAGIYLLIDVNSPIIGESLNRLAPWEDYYTPSYSERVLKLVHEFMFYDNTIGFFSANEIINEASVKQVPQYVRATTRDIKQYIAKHAKREVPVGYSAADVRPLLKDTFNYFQCNSEEDPWSRVDFFGLNSYSWCGESDAKKAGYDLLVSDFSTTTVPVFFSEYGCNAVPGARPFNEVQYIYAAPMANVFSGGVAYEFTQEDNKYGLLKWATDKIELFKDFDNFQKQMATVNIPNLTKANATALALTPPSCSTVRSSSNITSNFTVPWRPVAVQGFIDNGVVTGAPKTLTPITLATAITGVQGSDGSPVAVKLNILAAGDSNLPGSTKQSTNPNGTPISPASTPSAAAGAAAASGTKAGAASRGGVGLGLLVVVASAAMAALW